MVKCKICGQEFKNGKQLGGHLSSVHSTKEHREKIKVALKHERIKLKVSCNKCGKEFVYEAIKDSKDLKRKKKFCSRKCANSHSKIWNCDFCDQNFPNRKIFYQHRKLHFQEKKFLRGKQIFEKHLIQNIRPPSNLRERLINFGYKEDKCEKCGWANKFSGDKYSRCQLHHKDGNAHNNMLNNLEILCPNCHSLTNNWGKRSNHKSSRIYRYNKGIMYNTERETAYHESEAI